MDDVESSLKQITAITEQTQELYKKLTNVQQILNRATAVLMLAVAIISLDTSEITSSIQNLVA